MGRHRWGRRWGRGADAVPVVERVPIVHLGERREPELGGQRGDRVLRGPDPGTTEVGDVTPGQRVVERAPAHPVPCLEDDDRAAGRRQRAGGGQPGEPGAHHDDVGGEHPPTAARRRGGRGGGRGERRGSRRERGAGDQLAPRELRHGGRFLTSERGWGYGPYNEPGSGSSRPGRDEAQVSDPGFVVLGGSVAVRERWSPTVDVVDGADLGEHLGRAEPRASAGRSGSPAVLDGRAQHRGQHDAHPDGQHRG